MLFRSAGRHAESVELCQEALAIYGYQEFVEALRRGNAGGGPKVALREWMRAVEEFTKHQWFPSYAPAFVYANLGDKDRAFAWLEKAYKEHNWCILYLKDDPIWDPIRSDPRFKDLVRRVGLPP